MFGPCFAIQYLVSFLVCNHSAREERADRFILIVYLLSCDCKCSVSLPHGVVGWSAVCDCVIFWTLRFKNCTQHRRLPDVIPHNIVNRIAFRLKKDGPNIAFKS